MLNPDSLTSGWTKIERNKVATRFWALWGTLGQGRLEARGITGNYHLHPRRALYRQAAQEGLPANAAVSGADHIQAKHLPLPWALTALAMIVATLTIRPPFQAALTYGWRRAKGRYVLGGRAPDPNADWGSQHTSSCPLQLLAYHTPLRPKACTNPSSQRVDTARRRGASSHF